MTELVSLLVGVFCVLGAVITWNQQKRAQYHAMEHFTAQFVAAVKDIIDDPSIPEDIKKFYLRISDAIDDRDLARDLAEDIASGAISRHSDSPPVIDREALPLEQRVKTIKATVLFVVALSFTYPKKGWLLREYVLDNDVDRHAASAAKLIYANELMSHPQAA